MRRILASCLVPCLLIAAAACRSEDPRQAQASRERRGVDELAQAARHAPGVTSTGRWDEAQLTQRLVSAGLAPRPDDSIPAYPDFKTRPLTYRVGAAHLLAWIYADSLVRRSVSSGIDTLTAFPRGDSSAWDELPMFVAQNNLLAVTVGGSERQRERIRLALEAGLPAPPR